MMRYLALALLMAPMAAYGQYYPQRMDPQEASVIADYWIRSYLRRSASPVEQQRLADQLLSSRTPAHALAALLASRDYYTYAGGTPYDFQRQLIEDVGHYEPSPYEVEARLQGTGGLSPQAIALEFLRQYPKNWWPGPAATPPRELQYFYGYGRYGGRPSWRF
jgi:hypothetical protein